MTSQWLQCQPKLSDLGWLTSATAATSLVYRGLTSINRGPNHRIGRQIPAPFVFCFIFWSRDRSKGDTGYQWYQMRLQSFGWCSGNLKLHYIIKNWLVWLFCGRATFLVRFCWSLPHERRKCRLGWRRAEGLIVSGGGWVWFQSRAVISLIVPASFSLFSWSHVWSFLWRAVLVPIHSWGYLFCLAEVAGCAKRGHEAMFYL